MATEPVPALIETDGTEIPAPAHAHINRVRVVFSFFAINFIWGSTYLAVHYAVATIPPLYAAGSRHLTAGLILLGLCIRKRLRPTWAQVRAGFVIGFLFFFIGHGTLHWGLVRVPSGLAALLIASEPIWVFLLSEWAARRWEVNGALISGVTLGLAGVALLMEGSFVVAKPGAFVSAVAILIGAFSWAAGIVYSRRSVLSGSPLLLSALSLLSGALLLLTAATLSGEYRGFTFAGVATRSWIALGYAIVFGSVITFSAYNWLLDHYSPTLVSTHTYVNPIVAVLLGWLLAGEKITPLVAVAAAMVIGAVILVDRGTARLHRV
ncbi:MAG: EamA family transporter [Candidatus Acidiferrales bacterium]